MSLPPHEFLKFSELASPLLAQDTLVNPDNKPKNQRGTKAKTFNL
jgi:hypothetical protein